MAGEDLDTLIQQETQAFNDKRNGVTETAKVETTAAPAQIETPAKVETSAAKVETPANTTAPNLYDPKWLKETFGTDKVEDVTTTYKGATQFKTQWEQADAKIKELESRTPVAPYKGGDLSAMIDNAIAKGVPLATIARIAPLNDAKLDELSKTSEGQAQIVKEYMALQKPHLSPRQIDALYNKDFAIVDPADEVEVDLKTAGLADKFQEARTGFKDYIGKTFDVPDPAKAETDRKAAITQLDTAWQSHLPTISNVVKEVSEEISIPKFGNPAESVKSNFKFELTPEMQKEVMGIVHRDILAQGINPDDAGRKMVTDYAKTVMMAKYGDVIRKQVVEYALSEQLKQFQDEIHNPNINKTLPAGGGRGADGLTALERQILKVA